MLKITRSLSLIALFALIGGAGAWAQDDAATPDEAAEAAEAGAEQSESDLGLNMGEPAADPNAPGTSFVGEKFGDWEQRCIRTETGSDPCQLYQLLRDANGNAVAEMSIFALPDGGQVAAGSTIITPLETLLTRQITIAVDSGQARRYPFDFCAEAGCFSRIGLTDADVLAFKRGNAARMTIVPAAAPDQTIELTISLSGFTAGYDATAERNAANAQAARQQ